MSRSALAAVFMGNRGPGTAANAQSAKVVVSASNKSTASLGLSSRRDDVSQTHRVNSLALTKQCLL